MKAPGSTSEGTPQVPSPPVRRRAKPIASPSPTCEPPPLPTSTASTAPKAAPAPANAPIAIEPSPPLKWRFLRLFPSWLVSAVLHLGILFVLAWWTIRDKDTSLALITIQGSAADAAEDLPEADEWVQEIEASSDVRVESPDGVYVGAMEAGSPVLDAAVGGESVALDGLTGSSTTQIGALFVPGGGAMSSNESALLKKEAMFYGVKARGNRFVFIVDSSNSMRGNKFMEAKRELIYAIRRLGKDQYFYVIFFDANAERMVLDPDPNLPTEPAPHPVPATGENMLKVERWIGTVQNELKTNPYDAVKFAMELSPDAIYLLTDGQFTDKGKTVRYLARENFITDDLGHRQVKVVFHTIGFYSRDGEDVLKEIARKYKGTYHFVAPPK